MQVRGLRVAMLDLNLAVPFGRVEYIRLRGGGVATVFHDSRAMTPAAPFLFLGLDAHGYWQSWGPNGNWREDCVEHPLDLLPSGKEAA